jgi:predicted metal-dependent HD superfamily phosphohydrolase
MDLQVRWNQLWFSLQVSEVPANTFAELVAAYSSQDRFYHTLSHIEDCLPVFDDGKEFARRPAEVELAIWFHDAVYDTKAAGNEQRSAEWAQRVATESGLDKSTAERVSSLILATCHTEEASETDAQLLVDVDLSILGRESQVFWEYEQNIRKEYEWVPISIYRQKRREILQSFLDRPNIYQLDLYRRLYESQARENVQQAISRLKT